MLSTVLLLMTLLALLSAGFAVGFCCGRCRDAAIANRGDNGDQAANNSAAKDPPRFAPAANASELGHEPLLRADEIEIACTTQAAEGKIMIVDDEPINIKTAQKYLTLAGFHNIIGVTDSTTVLSRMAEEQPDVVLLDILMPQISGLELLERIRATKQWAYLPVIMVTAFGNEVTKVQALQLGATDFLCKPINSIEMIPRVRNVLLVKSHHDSLLRYARELESQTRQLQSQVAQATDEG